MAKINVGFRLTESQVSYLIDIGEGDKTAGINEILRQHGHVVAIENVFSEQYKHPKLKKQHLYEGNLIAIKTITAYCYKVKGKYIWETSASIKKAGYKRTSELDMSRDVER